jgi:hypothetical protein
MGRECSLSGAQVDVSFRSSFPSVSLAVLAVALAATGPASLVACGGHASPDDCARMVDHYLDLAVRESPGGTKVSATQAAAVRDVEQGLKRAEPSYRRVQDRCGSVDRSEARCALRASTTADWEACLRGPHPTAGE